MSGSFPIAVVVVSGIVYHVAQKASGAARPWPMLMVAYGAALAVTLLISLAGGNGGGWQPGRREVAWGLLVGLAAFGIEAGFFFIYRAGWPLASASVIASISVAAILALAGIVLFGEPLSMTRAAGLAFAAAGVALIARG